MQETAGELHVSETPVPEPIRLKMYASWEMSFPTWVVFQAGSFLLLFALLAGCFEVLTPSTHYGELLYEKLEQEPVALKILSWAPLGLLLVGIAELCETAVALFQFRKMWREARTEEAVEAEV